MTYTPGQKPIPGRIVHYVSHGSPVLPDGTQTFPPREDIPALITEVAENQENVGLHVFNPTGDFKHPLALNGGVIHDEGRAPGTWHWIPREPATRGGLEAAGDQLLAAVAGDEAPRTGCCRERGAGDQGATRG